MEPFEWDCPHCSFRQLVTEKNYGQVTGPLHIGETIYGRIAGATEVIRCLRVGCNNISVATSIHEYSHSQFGIHIGKSIITWRVYPDVAVKVQPDCIPKVFIEDYYEACRIREISPKASATLSRRCLQGMIRDFCKIKSKTLYLEIEELRKRVDEGSEPRGVSAETIDAMDAVRKVGNIGAHMEGDVNSIIDVDAGEAQSLIELIEMLFEEWYIARKVREDRLSRVKAVAQAKDER